MIWTLPDSTVARGSAAMKALCQERGLDWEPFRQREQKGLARRRGGPREVRLPDDWRARLDPIFGADAVLEFHRDGPERRPAFLVTPNALDTAWSHQLAAAADLLFLVRGRINYVDARTGEQVGSNPKGTAIWLFADAADDRARFLDALRGCGAAGRFWRGPVRDNRPAD